MGITKIFATVSEKVFLTRLMTNIFHYSKSSQSHPHAIVLLLFPKVCFVLVYRKVYKATPYAKGVLLQITGVSLVIQFFIFWWWLDTCQQDFYFFSFLFSLLWSEMRNRILNLILRSFKTFRSTFDGLDFLINARRNHENVWIVL